MAVHRHVLSRGLLPLGPAQSERRYRLVVEKTLTPPPGRPSTRRTCWCSLWPVLPVFLRFALRGTGSAVLVRVTGWARSFRPSMFVRMPLLSRSTLRKVPWWTAWRSMIPNQTSTVDKATTAPHANAAGDRNPLSRASQPNPGQCCRRHAQQAQDGGTDDIGHTAAAERRARGSTGRWSRPRRAPRDPERACCPV